MIMSANAIWAPLRHYHQNVARRVCINKRHDALELEFVSDIVVDENV